MSSFRPTNAKMGGQEINSMPRNGKEEELHSCTCNCQNHILDKLYCSQKVGDIKLLNLYKLEKKYKIHL